MAERKVVHTFVIAPGYYLYREGNSFSIDVVFYLFNEAVRVPVGKNIIGLILYILAFKSPCSCWEMELFSF
jgi:hypothetical protein